MYHELYYGMELYLHELFNNGLSPKGLEHLRNTFIVIERIKIVEGKHVVCVEHLGQELYFSIRHLTACVGPNIKSKWIITYHGFEVQVDSPYATTDFSNNLRLISESFFSKIPFIHQKMTEKMTMLQNELNIIKQYRNML